MNSPRYAGFEQSPGLLRAFTNDLFISAISF